MADRVRMSDVARVAEVSKTTVSLVLNEIPGVRIPEGTRARIFRVARELGYRHRPAQHHDEDQPITSVGVLINEISASYPINLLDGLQIAAEQRDIQLIIQMNGAGPEQERDALRNFHRLGITGVIYATTFHAEVEPCVELDRFRHVFLNCRRREGDGHAVVSDEYASGQAAARILLGSRATRIATLTGDPWQVATRERLSGFQDTLALAGLEPIAVEAANWSHALARAATEQLLAQGARLDGLFCQNDIMARGAYAALRAAGIRVPQDVCVVGHDDREFAADLEPPLTTLTMAHADMAELALERLLGGEALGDRIEALAGETILRGSSVR